jgi:hypothetical protein
MAEAFKKLSMFLEKPSGPAAASTGSGADEE